MHQPPPSSPIRTLLAMPAIGLAGVERSIIFPLLPASAQAKVRAAVTEQEKVCQATEAGDRLPVIEEAYAHFVVNPELRRQAGLAFPSLGNLDDFPLPGVLRAGDRDWLRPQHHIQAVVLREQRMDWIVEVRYADGIVRTARAMTEALLTRRQARQLQVHVVRVIWMFGLRSGALPVTARDR